MAGGAKDERGPGAQPDAPSRVRLVGTFAIERGSGVLEGAALGSRKARTLVKLLAVRRGDLVSVDAIADALWNDDPPAKAAENVASLVSRLRALLGKDVIEGGREGYRLRLPPGCEVDVDEADRLVAEAASRLDAGAPALAVTASDRALELIGSGRVLTDEADAPWVDDANRQALALLQRARETGWRARFALDDHRGGLAIATRTLADDPLYEDAHRAVMSAHHALGEPGKALAAYERLREMLAEEFGADPSPESEQLYLNVLRGERGGDQPDSTRQTAAQHHPTQRSTPLVGRDHELTTLLATWSQATEGAASCVLITGHAGIGKTRLAHELVDQARATGALAVESRCYPAERSLFLQPIVEAIQTIVATEPPEAVREAVGDNNGQLGTLVPEIADLVGPVDYQPAGAEVERRRVFEAIGSFFAGLARRRPILVVLDDLHEAGSSTVELCHFVLRWRPVAKLLVAATVRADHSHDVLAQLEPLGTTIELGPLADDAVYSLARDAGLGEVAPQLVEKTRGHPLFVVEAMRAVGESGAADAMIPVPPSLRSAVLTRVERAGEPVVELLQAAVVIGGAFDLEQVAALLDVPLEDAARRAEQALRAGLLAEADRVYEFANDLVRDIVYASVPAPARVARHRRLAGMMADRPEAAATHAAAAGDWSMAAEHWIEAAIRATAAFANHEAELLLTRAIDAYANVADAAQSPGDAVWVRLLRGRARQAQGHYDPASDDFAAAEELARDDGDDAFEAAAIADQGWVAYHRRDMAHAYSLAERAMAHPGADVEISLLAGRMRNTAGDLQGALAALEPVTDHEDPSVRAKALSYLGTVLAHSDRYAESIETLDRAGELCRRAGLLRPMINAWMFGAMSHANLGDFETALRWTQRLRHDADRFDVTFYQPRALNVEAWIWRELGEPGRAFDLAQQALEACVLPNGRTEEEPAANALLQLAESALLDGDDAEAERRLGEISTHAGGVGFAWRIELRRLELEARLEPARAATLLDRARERGSAKYEGLALAHLGHHEQAMTVAGATDSPFLLARVAPERAARAAIEELAARLSAEHRETFLRRGAVILGHRG